MSTLLLFIACLILSVMAGKKEQMQLQPEVLAQKKLDAMYELEKKSIGHVIELTPDLFLEYVQKNPRPYDVVMMWNIPPGKCDHCQEVSKEFYQAAYSFYSYRSNPSALNNKKIFFVKLLFI